MKAIIMAGGEGSRLRPLTCDLPKPLTPVLNRPVMEHIIELLKEHGIYDIGVTLQYLPEAIQDYFDDGSRWGVNLRYFIEDSPLGTAGSVKNAEQFLDEPFLVISGDALTDFNLTQAINFHQQKGALATIVLTKVDSPLEYGVVMTDKAGRIQRFLEKPSWGEVFSDTVNTGIYILEPEILGYFDKGQKFDFSKDLFPMVLANKQPFYGCTLDGYWCDIGNLDQYIQAQHDILRGKVKVKMPGREVLPGVWVEDGVKIAPDARIQGPVLIGRDTVINSKVRIEPYTILGSNNLIDEEASIKRSILWDHTHVEPRVHLRGAVLCKKVRAKHKSQIYDGAVIGNETVLHSGSIVKNGVKIWPAKEVGTGTVVNRSLIWGYRKGKNYFGNDGIGGYYNRELTPEIATQVGIAFASVLGKGTRVTLSSDVGISSQSVKAALLAGLTAGGSQILDLGVTCTPVARFFVTELASAGGVHVKEDDLRPGFLRINLLNAKGANISKGDERKLENLLAREDMARVPAEEVRPVIAVPDANENYLSFLFEGLEPEYIPWSPRVVVSHLPRNLSLVLPPILDGLKVQVTYLDPYNTAKVSKDKAIRELKEAVVQQGADLGLWLDSNGEELAIVSEIGQVLSEQNLATLLSVIYWNKYPGTTWVSSVHDSHVLESLAEKYQGKVKRSKTGRQTIMEEMLALTNRDQFLLNFDALYAVSKIVQWLGQEGIGLSQVVAQIPSTQRIKKVVACPWEAKGRVMRRLVEDHEHEQMELIDGVKFIRDDGWALVLPDPEEPHCTIYGEGFNAEIAEALTDELLRKIEIIKSNEI